jgi:hypothetical protein
MPMWGPNCKPIDKQSIRKMDFGQIATGADISIAQLREEFGSTIDVLTAHVEEMDCLDDRFHETTQFGPRL